MICGKLELEFHVPLNCILLDFGEIKLHVRTRLSEIKFQKDATLLNKLWQRLYNKIILENVKFRWNYNVGPLSLPLEHSWSLKFQLSIVGPSSLKNELY